VVETVDSNCGVVCTGSVIVYRRFIHHEGNIYANTWLVDRQTINIGSCKLRYWQAKMVKDNQLFICWCAKFLGLSVTAMTMKWSPWVFSSTLLVWSVRL